MKPLLDALRPLLDRWKAMALPRQMALIAAIALLVGGAIWGWAAANTPTYAVLFSNLEEGDAGAIVERLKAQKVTFKLERAGTEIWVPEQTVHETRLQLAGEGLPNGGGAGFELFDQQKFGESEFSEQVKYHRALEGELTRTITHVAGVESARVHLVLPARSVFVNAENNASASIALRLKPGAKLTRDQTKGLVHLVASSVRGLAPENVTIIDGSGRRLSGGEEESEQATSGLDFQRSYERAQEHSLQQILDATLGPGRAMVRVAAEVSFAREETTEERVDPSSVASRSFQITEERENTASGSAGGVPGAVGTLDGADPAMATTTDKGLVRRSETRNFEISKITRHAVEPVGRVTRLSVAVVVDGVWKGKGDKRTYVARTPAELGTIKNVVATAVGTKDDRGDRVTVECVPFAEQTVEPPVAEAGFDVVIRKNWPYAAAAGGALLVLVLAGMMISIARRKPAPRLDVKLTAETPPQLLEQIGATANNPSLPAPDAVGTAALSADAQAEAERIRALTAEIASGDPYLAARVVRGWLSETNSEEAA
jgi:flagellar M-ring protein FliF